MMTTCMNVNEIINALTLLGTVGSANGCRQLRTRIVHRCISPQVVALDFSKVQAVYVVLWN